MFIVIVQKKHIEYFFIYKVYLCLISYSLKDSQDFDNQEVAAETPSMLNKLSSPSLTTSSLKDDMQSLNEQHADRRVIKSCAWSTVIFSINFVSSILVINLSKW